MENIDLENLSNEELLDLLNTLNGMQDELSEIEGEINE
jgi:hypothetical protein